MKDYVLMRKCVITNDNAIRTTNKGHHMIGLEKYPHQVKLKIYNTNSLTRKDYVLMRKWGFIKDSTPITRNTTHHKWSVARQIATLSEMAKIKHNNN